jgi:photosystem II stability/assembly factor-like uncharacterized protein/tetratricopeptide (TPR) repeat protein
MKLFCFILLLSISISSAGVQGQNVQQSGTTADLYSIWFVDDHTGWIVGDRGVILHTKNSGKTWTQQHTRNTGPLFAVYFFDEFTGWIAGEDNLILYTSDGGESWSEQRPSPVSGQDLTALYFFDWKRGFTAGGPGGNIYYTENAGTTWSRRSAFGSEITVRSIGFPGHEKGWAAYNNRIHLTENRGQSWTDAIEFADNETFRFQDLHFPDPSAGWAAGNSNSDGKLLQTFNGGSEWVDQFTFPDQTLRSVHFYDELNGQVLAANGDHFTTRDGGNYWYHTAADNGNINLETFFTSDQFTWGAGENGVIIRYESPEFVYPHVSGKSYPVVEIADEDEAVALLNRALQYAKGAEEKSIISDRKSHYIRLRGAIDNVQRFYTDQNMPGYISQRIDELIEIYSVTEHNAGADLFNRGTESADSLQLFRTSAAHFENSIIIEPDSSLSYHSLARAREKLGDLHGAIRALEDGFSRMDKPSVSHYGFLLSLHQKAGNQNDARQVAKEALSIYPDEVLFLKHLTDLHLEAGDIENARNYLESLIDLEPGNPEYRFVRGSQLFLRGYGYLEEALRRYEDVWRLKERQQQDLTPDQIRDIEAEIERAIRESDRLEREGNLFTDRAVQDLRWAADLQPGDDAIQGYLGMIYYNRAAIYEEKRLLTPDFDEAQSIGETVNREINKAREHYEEATRLNSENREYWESLHQIYLFLEMYRDAERVRNRL